MNHWFDGFILSQATQWIYRQNLCDCNIYCGIDRLNTINPFK